MRAAAVVGAVVVGPMLLAADDTALVPVPAVAVLAVGVEWIVAVVGVELAVAARAAVLNRESFPPIQIFARETHSTTFAPLTLLFARTPHAHVRFGIEES